MNYHVNSHYTEYKSLDNNTISIEIPATGALDFELKAVEPEVKMNESGKTEIKVKAILKYVFADDKEEVKTDLVLHDKTGKEIDRKKDIVFKKDTVEQDIKFELDSSIFTEEETNLSVVINADYLLTKSSPEEREKVDKLKDNKVEIKVTKKSADFSIRSETSYKSKEKDGKNVDVKFKVALSNTAETITTNVVLYKGNTSIGTKSITFNGGSEQIVTFSVPEGSLNVGSNQLTAIVNGGKNKTEYNIIITQ